MGKIHLLSDSMIGKIAAGEVVERPASAIKELIENSLDAGATAITAEIREGGLQYIRVTDNGCGIEESDIRMAFERHATSKITREDDLFSIATLGFRGEALASIAAVSHVSLITRTAENNSGLKVLNEGGRILSVEETACPTGTTITVTNLFFNTPVRKGFMKKPSVEAGQIGDLLLQFILSRPDVSFRFISSGKVVYHSPGDGQLTSAVHAIYGGQTLRSLRKVEGRMNGILLHGFVGIGDNARGNRNHEFFFVNGRMMHSSTLSSSLELACRERVMIGKFPICILHIQISYDAVDVNIHPNKLEVRFRDEAGVGEAVTTLVLEALKDRDAFEKPVEMNLTPARTTYSEPVVRFSPDLPEKAAEAIQQGLKNQKADVTVLKTIPSEANCSGNVRPEVPPDPVFCETGTFRKEKTVEPDATIHPAISTASPDSADMPQRYEKAEQINTILPEIRKQFRVFGAVFHTYILVEYEDHLLLIDQHAVHERLLFDRLMEEHKEQNLGQELLTPAIISLTQKEMKLLEENRKELESIGLVIERFGEKDAAVRTIPMILGETETIGFIRDILSDLEEGKTLSFEKKRADLLQTACKHAVKGGESLSEDQLRSLVEEMIDRKVTPTCPHGRPLVVSISHRELDKKFKRIQN